MYVCIYTCTLYTHKHTHTHLHIHVHVLTHTYTLTHSHTHTLTGDSGHLLSVGGSGSDEVRAAADGDVGSKVMGDGGRASGTGTG